jgi:hypothetical protein
MQGAPAERSIQADARTPMFDRIHSIFFVQSMYKRGIGYGVEDEMSYLTLSITHIQMPVAWGDGRQNMCARRAPSD